MINKKFQCDNCRKDVIEGGNIGTKNRNHCPFCLFSKHLDSKISGDRLANCGGLMKPIGLTFREEGADKSGQKKQGEIMLIHLCQRCQHLSINRIAGDDDEKKITEILSNSADLSLVLKEKIRANDVKLLDKASEPKVKIQLFGKIK